MNEASKAEIIIEKDNTAFKFGPSKVYYAHKKAIIPIQIGKNKKSVSISIVSANIPLLLGKDLFSELEGNLDFKHETLKLKNDEEELAFKLFKTKSKH